MTISSTTRRAGPYTGNSVTTAFPFAFKVFAATDVLVVEAVVATGVETVKTLTTHYTVALNPDQEVSPGGTVNMLAAPTAAQTITVGSQVPNLQPVEVTNGGGFYPPVLNDALDRATIQIQQLEEQMSRVVGAPISTPAGVDYALPAPAANMVLGWNAGATALVNVSPAEFGGGGGSAVLGGVTVANFTLDHSTPNGRHEIVDTNPLGWNALPSRMSVAFEFVSNNYFLYNPGGHVPIVLRQDMDIIATQVSGNGAILGDMTWSGFGGDKALFEPTSMIETWNPAIGAGERWVFPHTTGPRNAPLLDGTRYRMVIESTVSTEGKRYARYQLYKYAGATLNGWDMLVDTGDVLDHNDNADFTKSGLVFAHVVEDNLGTWSIDFSNIKVTWGPPGNILSDNQARLSKFGADLSGDLNFIGNARRIQAPFNAGPSLTNSLTFQSADANTATTLVAKPNGTSTTANFLFSNNSSSAATYGAVTFGMSGAVGLIESFGYSASNPEIGVNVGAGARIATFKATGIQVLNAATLVGPVSASMTGMNSIGGSNATSFAASAFNFDTTCADGTIRTYMSATPTNVQIEQVVRPLYCFLSCLLAELRNRKVI